jgi:hypothetical protein
MDALRELDDGRLVMETPPDPRTRATSIELDPLEWIHRITSHIPDRGRHCQRFYGAYSNRGRISVAAPGDDTAGFPAGKPSERDNSDVSREARSTWALLIEKIFEADPLLCTCGGRMRIVSFITDPRVVDRSCDIAKASVAKPRILSNRGRLRPQSQTLCNNSKTAEDVRMNSRTIVG